GDSESLDLLQDGVDGNAAPVELLPESRIVGAQSLFACRIVFLDSIRGDHKIHNCLLVSVTMGRTQRESVRPCPGNPAIAQPAVSPLAALRASSCRYFSASQSVS